jgi:putative FmdB family regulatory protein
MPLYEYECEQCSDRFELIRKFSDPPLETCPKCGGPVRKLFSSPAIQFKGSGWYITDYAKKSSSDARDAGKGGPEKGESDKGRADKADSGSKSDSDGKSDPGKSDAGSKSDSASATTSSETSSAKPSTTKAD